MGSANAYSKTNSQWELTCAAFIVQQGQSDLLEVVRARRTAGGLAADWMAGNRRATKMPIIAMTTSSSTSVKPRDFPVRIMNLPHQCGGRIMILQNRAEIKERAPALP